MPKILTQEQVDAYWRDGCIFPIRVMSAADAGELRRRLEAFEAETGGPLKGDLRHKSHLLFAWNFYTMSRRTVEAPVAAMTPSTT